MNSKYYQSNVFSSVDTADQTRFYFFAPQLCFELNNLNRKQYASAGAHLNISFTYVNGMEGTLPGSTMSDRTETHNHHDWIQFRVVYDNYFETIGPLKLGFYGEGLISNQPLFSNYTASIIYAPGFQPIPEMISLFLPPFRATNYAAAGLKTILKVFKKIDFRLEGYIFQPYQEILSNPEDQTAYFGPIFSDRSYLATAALVYNTFLGPLSIGVNYYDKTRNQFQFNLNFGYIIFNRKALP
jgi:NTE family protein